MHKLLQHNSFIFLLLFIAGFVIYSNVIPGDFLFDDNLFIENNEQIRSLSNIPELYFSSVTEGSSVSKDNFYRPNQQLINSLIYSLFGLNPVPFHIASILFHILNGFLLFLLFIKLKMKRNVSLVSSLIFIIHPVNTQAVSYISGMADPMGLMFILLALLNFLAFTEEKKSGNFLFAGLSIFFFTCGLFTKENTIIFPAIASITFIFLLPANDDLSKKKNHLYILLGMYFSLAIAYLYFKFTILNFSGNFGLTDQTNIYTENLHIRLITFVNILPEYFKMILFPIRLNYEKPYTAFVDFQSPGGILSMIMIVAGIAGAIYSLLKKSKTFFFAFTWFFVCLSPVSGIIPVNAMYLEHWLYYPLIGVIFWIASIYQRQKGLLKTGIFILIIPLCLAYSIRSIIRNSQWADGIEFYKNELKYSNSARIHNNIAMIYSDQEKCPLAIIHYKKAISLYDIYPQTHYNLARCYESLGQVNDAVSEYFNSLILYPDFTYSHKNLHDIFIRSGDTAQAEVVENFLSRIQHGEKIQPQEISNLVNSLKK